MLTDDSPQVIKEFPAQFLERLKNIIPQHHFAACMDTFRKATPLTVRINSLRTSNDEILQKLNDKHIGLTQVSWYDKALCIRSETVEDLKQSDCFLKGELYSQSLSSMLPVLVLDPRPGESVLDMCAAPGSKTTQIASHMNNTGAIVAVEAIRSRYYKLKSVVTLTGAKIVSCVLTDARRFRPRLNFLQNNSSRQNSKRASLDGTFDKVLLDAPCSSEGRFKTLDPKSYAYWSLRKIEEMVRKQRGLILSASRHVKPGGTLVYSTCSFSPEENEGVLDWLLKKAKQHFEIVPIDFADIDSYPAIIQWKGKMFEAAVQNAFRVLPSAAMEGFFIAKLKRLS